MVPTSSTIEGRPASAVRLSDSSRRSARTQVCRRSIDPSAARVVHVEHDSSRRRTAPGRGFCSAPMRSAAMCSAACYMARGCRWASPSVATALALVLGAIARSDRRICRRRVGRRSHARLRTSFSSCRSFTSCIVLRAAMPLVLTTAQVFWTMTAMLGLAGWPFPATGRPSGRGAGKKKGVRRSCARARGWVVADSATSLYFRPLAAFLAVQGTLLLPAFILAGGDAVVRGLWVRRTDSKLGSYASRSGRRGDPRRCALAPGAGRRQLSSASSLYTCFRRLVRHLGASVSDKSIKSIT